MLWIEWIKMFSDCFRSVRDGRDWDLIYAPFIARRASFIRRSVPPTSFPTLSLRRNINSRDNHRQCAMNWEARKKKVLTDGTTTNRQLVGKGRAWLLNLGSRRRKSIWRGGTWLWYAINNSDEKKEDSKMKIKCLSLLDKAPTEIINTDSGDDPT